jgi:mannosyltransferase OCH1-like enzyme
MIQKIGRPAGLIAKSFEFARDFPYLRLGDKLGSPGIGGSIPRVVYQTWEENKFGRTHFLSLQKFRNLNPNYDFYLFDAARRDSYVRSKWYGSPLWEMYEKARFGQIKADLFRYLVLAEEGGFYFDISKALSVPIDIFLKNHHEALLSFETTPRPPHLSSYKDNDLLHRNKLLLQWGFGFRKGHELLLILLDQIEESYLTYRNAVQKSPKSEILRLTGPLAFTRAVDTFFSLKKPKSSVGQVSMDFGGTAILNLPGSGARHKRVKAYAAVRNERLFCES